MNLKQILRLIKKNKSLSNNMYCNIKLSEYKNRNKYVTQRNYVKSNRNENEKKIQNTSLSTIKSLIDSFTMSGERFVNNIYYVKFDVNFNKL